METESSLPHSQVPATCPYFEPNRSSPCPHIRLPENPSLYYPPIYTWVFQVVSFPHVSSPKPLLNPLASHTCYMPLPPHFSRFDHPKHVLDITTVLRCIKFSEKLLTYETHFERLSSSDGALIATMGHIFVLWIMRQRSLVVWYQPFWWTYNENSGMIFAETSVTIWQNKGCLNQYGHSIYVYESCRLKD
jgi:hypothetical protein